MFWNVNSRLTIIIENLPSISVYLGRCGMNIEVTYFYYKCLSQSNFCTRLTSLCVSDAFSIDNGLWFAKYGSSFINLPHLSFIDVKRSFFEMILNSLSPIDSLIMFSVHFVSADHRAAFTFACVTAKVNIMDEFFVYFFHYMYAIYFPNPITNLTIYPFTRFPTALRISLFTPQLDFQPHTESHYWSLHRIPNPIASLTTHPFTRFPTPH